MRSTFILTAVLTAACAQYELQSTFTGSTFFDNFIFYDSWDPTYGFVHYVDQLVAQQYDMISTTNTSAMWGVDTTQILDPDANLGRLSLRLISTQSWTHGLFIIDLAHMPANVCGTWPAFWMLGSGTWPQSGEIDIIEYTNDLPNNLMALHSTPNCTVAGADETGTLVAAECGAGGGITGCTVAATVPDNSGDAFNTIGGGVYAMEWTSVGISIWFFPRDAIPSAVTATSPDPTEFGTPAANFYGDCDFDAHFYNMSLLFDIDFCGSYAGNVWQANDCPMLDPTNGWASCNEWVALNPTAFNDSYWEVNYLKVFQNPSGFSPTTTASGSSVIPAISTSPAVGTALSGAEGRSSTYTMSLAGTVPSVTTGSFTATSSVLSVISSLSSAAIGSGTTLSASLASTSAVSDISTSTASTAPAPVSPASASLPPTSSAGALPLPPPPLPSSFSSSKVAASPASSALVCSGYTCTSYVYATVVETVTVPAIAAREIATPFAQTTPPPIELADRHAERGLLTFSCTFTVKPKSSSSHLPTTYGCTSSRLEVFNGTLYTETLMATASIHRGEPLHLFTYLKIESIVVQTCTTGPSPTTSEVTYTGSFTPTANYISLTTLTAFEVHETKRAAG